MTELSEEEKKAINEIKDLNKTIQLCTEIEYPFSEGKFKRIGLLLSEKDWNIFEIIINLINEKEKEIEELKEKKEEK